MLDIIPNEKIRFIGTIIFFLAILHTFLVKKFMHYSHKFNPGSITANFLHFLGEIEIVFGLWAAVLIFIWSMLFGSSSAISYIESLSFNEPIFVFVIMCLSATKPVISSTSHLINLVVKITPKAYQSILAYITILVIGPLLGSIITEPAAMTVTALLLRERYFNQSTNSKFKYATLGLLFVNVSIGGTLTNFAAPPVLMVARKWGWDNSFMLLTFGLKAISAILISTFLVTAIFFKELRKINISLPVNSVERRTIPWWMVAIHFIFIGLTIAHSHHTSFFVGLFLLFLGWVKVSVRYQDEIRLKESLLVAFFLAGLVTLGNLQDWWLKPLITDLHDLVLYFGTIGLTAFTDNAILTYLGTLIPDMNDSSKYYLVAGAITGGGLTVIANAPNPAGYGILQPCFGKEGISPLFLILGALPPTIIAAILFL